MWLVIRKFSSSDIGTYNCVSTNSLGKSEGTLRLYGECTNHPHQTHPLSTTPAKTTHDSKLTHFFTWPKTLESRSRLELTYESAQTSHRTKFQFYKRLKTLRRRNEALQRAETKH